MRRELLGGFLLFLLAPSLLWAEGAMVRLDPEQRSHLDVRTALPEPVSALPLALAPGRVAIPPAKEFAVTAVQAGVITRVNVPVGVKVTKGQVLAEVESIALVDLQRAVVDAHAVFKVATAKFQRDETLYREGVIAQSRWQETRSDFERAQASLRAAEQTLLASGIAAADIERIKDGNQINGLYPVLSPVEGIVLERLAIVGQKVDALAPLFRIGKLDELWLEVDMPQERVKEARIGDRITVESPKARARIIEIGQSVDPRNQSTDRIFKVPVAAVFYHEGRSYVFVKRKAGYEAVQVQVAGQEAYNVVLHEGLQGGEAIVVQGIAGLKASWLGMAGGGHGD
jgi:cobalt-zinc-cadmium efflux system membrane fusion protein